MSRILETLRRFASLFDRSRFDRELDAEIAFHIEGRIEDLVAGGLDRNAAVAQVRREFGSTLRVREMTRAAWQFGWLEDALGDIRYALRTFRRTPVFTLTAIFSLACGIGATSAMFGALDAVFWKRLAVADAGSLVRLSLTRVNAAATDGVPLGFVKQLTRSAIFSDLIVVSDDGLSFTYDDRAERIVGEAVSPNFFALMVMLGVATAAAAVPAYRAARVHPTIALRLE